VYADRNTAQSHLVSRWAP
jgi:hypothetical protein